MTTELERRERHLSLWEMEAELLDIMERLHRSYEGIEPANETELERLMDEHALATQEKRDRCAAFLSLCESMEDHLGDEIKKLQKRKEQTERARKGFSLLILKLMSRMDLTKLRGGSRVMTAVKNPPHVEVTNWNLLPMEFKVQPPAPPPKPKLAEIGATIKAGKQVPGAELVDGGHRLRID